MTDNFLRTLMGLLDMSEEDVADACGVPDKVISDTLRDNDEPMMLMLAVKLNEVVIGRLAKLMSARDLIQVALAKDKSLVVRGVKRQRKRKNARKKRRVP